MSRSLVMTAVCLALSAVAALADPSPESVPAVEIRGNGRPVVFLPGLGCDPSVYETAVESLAHSYRCYLVKLPGFAGQRPSDSPSADGLVAWVRRYLEENDLSDVALVGHSFSGWLALRIAAGFPRVSRLVIVDSVPFPAGLFRNVTEDMARSQAAAAEAAILSMSAAQFRSYEEASIALMAQDGTWRTALTDWACASDRKTIARLTAEMAGSNLCREIPAITARTLVLSSWTLGRVFGLDRGAVAARIREQYTPLKGARVEVADTAGHYIMLDAPEWFLRELEGFLGSR